VREQVAVQSAPTCLVISRMSVLSSAGSSELIAIDKHGRPGGHAGQPAGQAVAARRPAEDRRRTDPCHQRTGGSAVPMLPSRMPIRHGSSQSDAAADRAQERPVPWSFGTRPGLSQTACHGYPETCWAPWLRRIVSVAAVRRNAATGRPLPRADSRTKAVADGQPFGALDELTRMEMGPAARIRARRRPRSCSSHSISEAVYLSDASSYFQTPGGACRL
jgi:hypothetical protein